MMHEIKTKTESLQKINSSTFNGYIDVAYKRWSPNRLVTDSNAVDLAAKNKSPKCNFRHQESDPK